MSELPPVEPQEPAAAPAGTGAVPDSGGPMPAAARAAAEPVTALGGAAPAEAPKAADAAPRRGALAATAGNLRTGLGLLLRPALEPDLPPGLSASGGQLLLLFLVALLLGLAYDLYTVGWRGGKFDPYALPTVSFWALTTLFASWCLAAFDGRPARLLSLATAGFALGCWEALGAYALAIAADRFSLLDRFYAPLSWLPLIWIGLGYATFAARVGARRSRAGRLATFLLALILLLAPQWTVNPADRLWTAATAADRANTGPGSPQSEETLYGQFDILDDALDGVEEGQAGVTELFTIVFAGDGTQDVFLNEANGADAVMAEAFGSVERGVVLANSQRHPQERPFATVSSLQRALATMADRMNPDEDVLAIFLTSHGTADHRLVVSMPPYEFEDLSPERLRGLLDDAGIRYRVIIVSACYAGGFVEPLAGDDTMIIAAARADRTSFGCRDGALWTDFGQAYFSEALAQTASFEGAFQVAARRIGAREAKEGLQPSQPQLSVGAGIREQLRRLETRRGGRVLYAAAPATHHEP